MNAPTLSIIVAMAKGNVIGIDNDLPWHIPADLKRFKQVTLGKPVIMGRKTFESIFGMLGKPLPGRENIVISRSAQFDHDHTHCVTSIEDAVALAKNFATQYNLDEIFCIGGAQIYKQMLLICDRLYVTLVDKKVDGDAYFPEINAHEYSVVENDAFADVQENGDVLNYTFQTLERI